MARGLTLEKQNNKNGVRLDKFLGNMGVGTRSEVRNLIKYSHITVNGEVVKDPMFKVYPETDEITSFGEKVCYEEFVYLLLNKPQGCISATEDNKHKTVMDYIPGQLKRADLSPVGRLDIDTTGLLLITDDGELNHKLLKPQNHVIKEYVAELEEDDKVVLTEKTVDLFREGVVFNDGTKCMPAKLEIINQNKVKISVVEGKFHQIKKMMKAVGRTVIQLERVRFGSLVLEPDFERGQVIKLNNEQVKQLKNSMGQKIF